MIDIGSLHQHFTSLLGNEATPIAHDEIQPQINMDIDLDSEITLQEIKTAVEYPESWCLGYIVPIFKSGNYNEAKNYRGITLTNMLAKQTYQME